MEATVVLPCLNESASVAACVRAARRALRASGIDGEVLVVDNGSTDDSALAAREAGARVAFEPHRGYGRALRRGIAAARAPVIAIADADGTYELSRLGELLAPVLDGDADLVLGSRIAGSAPGAMPALHRYLGTPVLNHLIARTSGEPARRDSQSGFRAFRREAILALGLRGNGMELASEMLIRAARAGLRVAEVDVGYGPRIGKSKLRPISDGWRHLRAIHALREGRPA
jgi:glycosyltransferase involved in cell wall biosynthesis